VNTDREKVLQDARRVEVSTQSTIISRSCKHAKRRGNLNKGSVGGSSKESEAGERRFLVTLLDQILLKKTQKDGEDLVQISII